MEVLFVCTHNAGRSQMAEALFNRLAQERGLQVRAESAGTEPAETVHPEMTEMMRELDLDLSGNRPKLLTNEMVRRAGRVVTMGCAPDATSCPVLFIRRVDDWALPDPHGQPLERVRAIRDEIRQRVEALIGEIAATGVSETERQEH